MLERIPDYPINKQDAEGNTGLLLAYVRGHAALCKSLVKAGACLGVPNKKGETIFNYLLATKTLLYRQV
jgi:ankyrin repeat protein